MGTETIIERIKAEVKLLFEKDSSGHDYWHTLRVYRNAMKIAEKTDCDRETVALAALLHDADDEKLFATHGYANAVRIMSENGVAEEKIEKVKDIISKVSYRKDFQFPAAEPEGQIVQDADRLDAIGAIGIARTFAFGGSKGRPMYAPNEGTSSLAHFRDKLFRLKSMMNTEPAKEIAEQRDKVLHDFYDQFLIEWDSVHKLGTGIKKKESIMLIKRDGSAVWYSHKWLKALIRSSANRVLQYMTEEEIETADRIFEAEIRKQGKKILTNEEWRACAATALAEHKEVMTSFLATNKKENAEFFDEICDEMTKLAGQGDKSNGSVDSSLCSSKRALIVDAVEKVTYRNYHLTAEQKAAYDDGYIYIHDMGHRRDSINCCLFDMERVLTGGFEMGEMHYSEPATLREAFDVIASVSLNGAAQIYGGFTIPQIDELLSKYAAKSCEKYRQQYLSKGIAEDVAAELAEDNIREDFRLGFYSLEEKFNSIISPRGDYPFITITFGLGTDRYAQMASLAALEVRKTGHGEQGHRRPVLFPKLVFLFDHNLHTEGKELNHLFKSAIACSSKVMYPEYLSLTGEKGIVAEVYKKYGKVISPMCCRAFLTKWFERGGEMPADEKDEPVFIGRFNIGVVSLNLPMILQKSRVENTDFYRELDYYLELSRQIHISTYNFLAKKKAHTNPLAFMEGGLYGGTLKRDDTIEPLLKSATCSYGITALNELQQLYNQKSLAEDGTFALEVIKYINCKAAEFQKEDHIQYSVYGTPAESLCGRQAEKFKAMFGEIPNVSDRKYFSNSFHCHVSEDISPIKKQDLEARFWDYANGGKIQYVRFSAAHNIPALEQTVLHAMELGLYEGINLVLAYCNECGHQWGYDGKTPLEYCPKCKTSEMTVIERMCGYIAFTKVHGETRLNPAKMAEIADRVSM